MQSRDNPSTESDIFDERSSPLQTDFRSGADGTGTEKIFREFTSKDEATTFSLRSRSRMFTPDNREVITNNALQIAGEDFPLDEKNMVLSANWNPLPLTRDNKDDANNGLKLK